MANNIIPYQSDLRKRSRYLRHNASQSEILLWKNIKNQAYSVQFHRQVPMLDYSVDFYCHEIGLAIEMDGGSRDHKFLYDAKRQGRLEEEGVRSVRFSDKEIKEDMLNVLLVLEHEINELLSA